LGQKRFVRALLRYIIRNKNEKSRLIKRAPRFAFLTGRTAWRWVCAISSNFPRLFLFLAGRLRRPHPSAANASHWAGYHVESLLKIYAI